MEFVVVINIFMEVMYCVMFVVFGVLDVLFYNGVVIIVLGICGLIYWEVYVDIFVVVVVVFMIVLVVIILFEILFGGF